MSLIKGLASRHSSNYGHTHTRAHIQSHTHTNIRTAYPQQSGRWRRDLLKAFNGHCKNGWDSKSIFSSLCFIQRANVAICFETCTQTNTYETDDTAHREQLNLTFKWARGHTVKAVSKGDQIDRWFQICVMNERRVFFQGWVKKSTLMAWTLTSVAGHGSGCRSAPSTDQAWSNRSRASNFESGSQPSVWAPHTSW